MNDFELFTGAGAGKRSEEGCTITFNKGGRSISLSPKAYEALGGKNHVQLFYSRARNAIALKPASEDDPHSIRVQVTKLATRVAFKSFASTYVLQFFKAHKTVLKLEDDLFIAQLEPQHWRFGER